MRNTSLRFFVLAGILMFGLRAMQSMDGATRLHDAQTSLTGNRKDTEKARKLLLEIVQSGRAGGSPETLIWARIYLGYIEDRAQNRQAALGWYEKALTVKGASPGSLGIAKYGLGQPLDWIRHLDSMSAQPIKGTGKAYVTDQPPPSLTLASNLSVKERRDNFEALWSNIDTNYAHFALKSINWIETGQRYRARLSTLSGDDDFYMLMFQLVNELKDTHSWLQNYKPPIVAGVPDLSTDMFQEKPFVLDGPKAGWEVMLVDGMTPAEKMETLRLRLHACSSERAFRRQAGRSLLTGKMGDLTTVRLRSPQGEIETLSLKHGRSNLLPVRTLSIKLTKQRFVNFGRHSSGIGYIQIESFGGREELTNEFDHALRELRDAPGLIVDIRDNQGGFGHPEIVGRFLQEKTRVGFSYIKNGPGHTDFAKHEIYLGPTGDWQYTRTVVLLTNDVTGSASDLFACELRSAKNVLTVGTTTHGNLSGEAMYAVLPCGLVVRISNGYLTDAADRPIEVNGNIPDITVEPNIMDFLNRRDPVLDRAVNLIGR